MVNEKSYTIASEIEVKLRRLNDFVVRGSYPLMTDLKGTQSHNPILDSYSSEYLDLVEELKKVAALIDSEVKEARSV
jgi:hypothetical protein